MTWDSGIPPSVADVVHGRRARRSRRASAGVSGPPGTPHAGHDGRCSTSARPSSRAAADLFPMPPAEDDRYPDEDDLAAAVVGAGSRKRRARAPADPPMEVRVVHGNLAFARHVIAVGHYSGDAIVSAERHLDRALKGALTRRHQLGLYPGPLETSAVFTDPRCANPLFLGLQGALVVGLGTVGSLSAAQLTRSFERALLEYALERSKQSRRSSPRWLSPRRLGAADRHRRGRHLGGGLGLRAHPRRGAGQRDAGGDEAARSHRHARVHGVVGGPRSAGARSAAHVVGAGRPPAATSSWRRRST